MQRRSLSDILPRADREKLQDAWDSTRAADDLGPPPAGEYHCRILSGELFTAKAGTPGYKITFEIIDGDHAGRRAWHDIWLTPAALGLAKRDLSRIGVSHFDQLDRPLPHGILATVRLALRRDDDGTERNRVVRFDATGIEPTEPEPFAPDAGPGDGQAAESADTDRLDSDGFHWGDGSQEDPPTPGRGRGAYSQP